jgi:hypothetical protein
MMFQVYVAWFTFFITTLMAAIAWTLKAVIDNDRKITYIKAFYAVVVLFAIECVLGIAATVFMYNDLSLFTARVANIQAALSQPELNTRSVAQNPIPSMLGHALWLMGLTLLVNLLFLFYFALRASVPTNPARRARANY